MILWLALDHAHSLFAQSVHSFKNRVINFMGIYAASFYFVKEVVQGDIGPGASNTS